MHHPNSSTCNSALLSMRDAAKIAGAGLPTCYKKLMEAGHFKKLPDGKHIPKKHLVDAGLFVVDEGSFIKPGTTIRKSYIRVRATQQGAYFMQEIIDADTDAVGTDSAQ